MLVFLNVHDVRASIWRILQRAFMKKLRNTKHGILEMGEVVAVEYVEALSTSHCSQAGILMLIWSSGSINLINLETRECVQIFEDRDLHDCHPTAVAFFPQVP